MKQGTQSEEGPKSWPELETRTRLWAERLAARDGLAPPCWDHHQRQVITCPPLRRWIERVQVPTQDGQGGVSMVRKYLSLSDWACTLIGDRYLREPRWYASRPLEVVPPALPSACLDVVWQSEERACVLMHDVGSELEAWRASGDVGFALALDFLARMHSAWSGHRAWTGLSWLPSYEDFFRTTFAQHRAAVAGRLAEVPGGAMQLEGTPGFDLGIRVWLESLSPPSRERVLALWHDPAPLFERLRQVPQTVIHGDPGPQHFGLRGTGQNQQALLIDWEFVSWGPPSVDWVHLVLFRRFQSIPSTGFRQWANERYQASAAGCKVSPSFRRGSTYPAAAGWSTYMQDAGGDKLVAELWPMAVDLSTVLWVLAYGQRHGQALHHVPAAERSRHPAWSALQEEITLLEEACARWLR